MARSRLYPLFGPLLGIATVLAAGSALAQETKPSPCQKGINNNEGKAPPRAGPGPALVAVVPGLLIHGTGHWAAGDSCTAKRLLTLEAVGFGTALTSTALIAITGASRRIVAFAAATAGFGGGLLLLTALADLYGAAGGASRGATPLIQAPSLEAEIGYRYVHDPLFAYHNFVTADVAGRFGPLRLEPMLWTALDDDNGRYRFVGAYRFYGPRPEPGARSRDGSFLEMETAYTTHRYGTEHFTTRTLEASVVGRYDMARLSPTLAGLFAEMGLGYGVATTQYALAGVPSDAADMLLLRIAYGMYLGKPGRGDGELRAFYDHRRDAYAGGLPINSVAAGNVGHTGLRGYYYWNRSWGLGLELIYGSAWIAGVTLRFRQGGIP